MPTASKKILFFSHAAQFGGAEKSLLELLQRIDRAKYSPTVLLLSEGPLVAALEEAGIDIHIIEPDEEILDTRRDEFFTPGNIIASFQRAKMSRLVIRAVADYAKKIDAGLIYANTTKAHVIGALAGHRAKIPVLWHVRDYFPSPRLRMFYRLMARLYVRCVICNSKFTASQFARHKNINTVYNGVDPAKFVPVRPRDEVRLEFAIPEGAPVIGMAGRLEQWKGLQTFLRAAARISEDIKNARFLIVGDALYGDQQYPARLRKLAEDYGIADRVIFTGFRLDVPDLMSIMDVYAHPSIEPEPFGRVIIEAMLLSRPVVASDAGGPVEIVRHGETGILVEPGDSVALARAAVQLIDNPEVSRALGANGRERALSTFTLDKTISKIQEILDQILI